MKPSEVPARRGLSLGGWFFLWMLLVAVAALGATLAVVLYAQYQALEDRLEDRGRMAARAALYGDWSEGSGAILVTALPELVAAEVRQASGKLVWQYGAFSEADRPSSDREMLRIKEVVAQTGNGDAPSRMVELILSTRQVRVHVFQTGLRLAVTLLVVFALGLVVGAMLVNRVVEPLRFLAQKVAVFDPDAPGEEPNIRGAGREVHDLADAFGRMRGRLVAERRALATSEQRYRGLFESSPVGLVEVDEDGRIIGANPASRLLLGDQEHGVNLGAFTPAAEAEVTSALAGAEGTSLEVLWHSPGRPPAEVELHIQPLPEGGRSSNLVVIRDISDRLRRLGERWRRTLDEMREGVALLDDESRPIQENRAFAAFSESVLARLGRDHLRGRRLEWTQKVEGRSLRCVLAPVSDSGESVLVVRDETEWLRAEERLREAQKMEAVATLAGGVAHDFNNLLAGILLHVRLLEQHSGDEEEAVETIRLLAEEGTDVVKGMLDFARPESVPRTAVDLVQLVREQETLFRHMVPVGIDFFVTASVEKAQVMANGGALRRVVMNLVLNARDALGDGPGRIRVGVSKTQDTVILEVEDNGPGVPPSIRDRLFEPFLSLRREGRGAGLGLAVTYALVKEHEGSLEYEEVPTGGTLFRVKLPLCETPT